MTDMLQTIWAMRVFAQHVLLIVVVILALRFGAGPERSTAFVFVGMAVVDQLYHAIFGKVDLGSLDAGHLVIDSGATIALVLIALYANRMYTLWLGAFQLLALASHAVTAITPKISMIAYATMKIAPSYFQIALLAAGLLLHCKRKVNYGTYRSWSGSLPRWWLVGSGIWHRFSFARLAAWVRP